MIKQKKYITLIITLTLAILTLFTITASAQNVPTPIINGVNSVYNLGDTLNINLTSKAYTKNVSYKVSLTNTTTKKIYDISIGYSKATNPLKPTTFKFVIKTPGDYKLTVIALASATKKPSPNTAVKSFKVYNGLSIIKPNTKLSSKTLTGDLNICANNAALNNVKVNGIIYIDPGKNGVSNLNNVTATRIVVLSGGENSIYLNGVNTPSLDLQSTTHVRVVMSNSQIGNTTVKCYAILDSNNNNKTGNIYIAKGINGSNPVVEFRGTFTNPVTVQTNAIVATANFEGKHTQIPVLKIKSSGSSNNTVALNGDFKNVTVDSLSNIKISDSSSIEELTVNSGAQINSNIVSNIGVLTISSIDKNSAITLDGQYNDVKLTKESSINISSNTTVSAITVNAQSQINNIKGSKVGTITVALADKNSTVTLNGIFSNVNIIKEGKLTLADVTIVDKIRDNVKAEINISSKSIINTLEKNPDTIITGSGVIITAINHPEATGGSDSSIDKTSLSTAVDNAMALISNKTVGEKTGNVPQQAKDALQTAIDAAKSILNNAASTQEQLDNQLALLNTAVSKFNTAVIKEPLPMVEGASILLSDSPTPLAFSGSDNNYNIDLSTKDDKVTVKKLYVNASKDCTLTIEFMGQSRQFKLKSHEQKEIDVITDFGIPQNLAVAAILKNARVFFGENMDIIGELDDGINQSVVVHINVKLK